MEIRKRFAKNILVLYVAGKIDIDAALFIEETGHFVKEGLKKVLCNFQNVDMVDYNGLSILAIAYKNAVNQDGVMKFCNVPKHIKELFKAARLDSVFEIHPDEESALKSFALSSKVDKLVLRRRFKRIDVNAHLKYKAGLSANTKLSSGKVLNLSGDGLFVHSKDTHPLGSKLYLEMTLGTGKKPIIASGAVIWLADKELQPHSYPGMGIEFVNLAKTTQVKVIDFIDKNITHRTKA